MPSPLRRRLPPQEGRRRPDRGPGRDRQVGRPGRGAAAHRGRTADARRARRAARARLRLRCCPAVAGDRHRRPGARAGRPGRALRARRARRSRAPSRRCTPCSGRFSTSPPSGRCCSRSTICSGPTTPPCASSPTSPAASRTCRSFCWRPSARGSRTSTRSCSTRSASRPRSWWSPARSPLRGRGDRRRASRAGRARVRRRRAHRDGRQPAARARTGGRPRARGRASRRLARRRSALRRAPRGLANRRRTARAAEPDALATAQAVAVLGGGVTVHAAARLAGLDPERVAPPRGRSRAPICCAPSLRWPSCTRSSPTRSSSASRPASESCAMHARRRCCGGRRRGRGRRRSPAAGAAQRRSGCGRPCAPRRTPPRNAARRRARRLPATRLGRAGTGRAATLGSSSSSVSSRRCPVATKPPRTCRPRSTLLTEPEHASARRRRTRPHAAVHRALRGGSRPSPGGGRRAGRRPCGSARPTPGFRRDDCLVRRPRPHGDRGLRRRGVHRFPPR